MTPYTPIYDTQRYVTPLDGPPCYNDPGVYNDKQLSGMPLVQKMSDLNSLLDTRNMNYSSYKWTSTKDHGAQPGLILPLIKGLLIRQVSS